MSASNNIKHYFPGSNTPLGFYPYYDNILNTIDANKIFILKGGPGTGKSTFMNNISNYFSQFTKEHHHCSSDPNSLDAIVIKEAKVAVIDGTSPHSLDTKYPGVIDEIINFSAFWDDSMLSPFKDKIIETNNIKKAYFKKAYCYLSAAKNILDANYINNSLYLSKLKLDLIYDEILTSIFDPIKPTNNKPTTRKLFSSAITPDGFVNFSNNTLNNKHTFLITGNLLVSSKDIMCQINNRFLSMGYSTNCFYSPIDPDNLDTIIIPQLDICISVSNSYYNPNINSKNTFDLSTSLFENISQELSLVDALFSNSFEILDKARQAHNVLESYYIPCMNFGLVDVVFDKVVSQIETFL